MVKELSDKRQRPNKQITKSAQRYGEDERVTELTVKSTAHPSCSRSLGESVSGKRKLLSKWKHALHTKAAGWSPAFKSDWSL